MSYHDCDDDEDCGFVEPKRFRAVDLIGLGFNTVANIVADIASGLEEVANMVAGHTNWLDEQDDFATQARLEIETLTGSDDE